MAARQITTLYFNLQLDMFSMLIETQASLFDISFPLNEVLKMLVYGTSRWYFI
jgi:hypothetical protein